MFDPTVFENLKVVLEGAVYDLDLTGQIHILRRIDRLELAEMSRVYSLQFQPSGVAHATAELWLGAGIEDLAAEILEQPEAEPGCSLTLKFRTGIEADKAQESCAQIGRLVADIWGEDVQVEQRLSYLYGQSDGRLANEIRVHFDRKITEELIDDLPELVEHMLKTVRAL